jgi:hypothetical protein
MKEKCHMKKYILISMFSLLLNAVSFPSRSSLYGKFRVVRFDGENMIPIGGDIERY